MAGPYNLSATGSPKFTSGRAGFGQALLQYGTTNGYGFASAASPLVSGVISATTPWTIDTSFATVQVSGSIIVNSQFCDIVTSATGTLQAHIQEATLTTIDSGVVVTDGARHIVSVISTGGATPHYVIIVDNVVTNNVTGGAFVPPVSGHGNIGYTTQCTIGWIRVSSAALYGVTTATATSSTATNTPTSPYTHNTANLVALYLFQGNGNDSAGSADPATIGTVTVSSTGSVDTISYPAPVAGTNSISLIQLWAGNYTAGEAAVVGQSTTGTGAGSFTHPTGSGVPTFYTVVVTDSASNTTISNEVSVGTVNATAHYWQAGWSRTGTDAYTAAPSPFGQALYDSTGAFYWTMNATDNPCSGKWLPGGLGWTYECRIKTLDATTWDLVDVGGSVVAGQTVETSPAGTFPTLTVGGYISGNTTGILTIVSNTSIHDGNWHHLAFMYTPGATAFSAGTISICVDGVQTASAPWIYAPTYAASASPFWMGFPQTKATVDEVAVSTAAVYTAPFTPPTTVLGNRSNQILYQSFDASTAVDNNGLLQFPGAPVIVVSQPGMGANDVITFNPAVAGTNAISTYYLYRGTATGAESATALAVTPVFSGGVWTFTTPTAAFGTAYFYYVKTQDTSGFLGAASNEGFNINQGLFVYADNAALLYSPGNWVANANSLTLPADNATAWTNCAGAYLSVYFTGTRAAAVFDTLSSSTARVIWRIDKGNWQQGEAYGTLNLTPSLLGNRLHLLEMVVQAIPSYNWVTTTGQTGIAGHVTLLNFVLDAGATVTAPLARPGLVVVDGDSITMGWNCLTFSTGNWDLTIPNDASMAWPFLLGIMLNAEVSVRGYAQWGYTIQPYGNYAPPYAGTSTSLTAGVAAGSAVSIPVASSVGMVVGANVSIDVGGLQEIATITAIPDGTHVVATIANAHASGVAVTDTTNQPWNQLYQGGPTRTFSRDPDLWILAYGENDQLHGSSASVNNALVIANIATLYNNILAAHPLTKVVQLQYWAYNAYTGTSPDFAWAAISAAVAAVPNPRLSVLPCGTTFNPLTDGLLEALVNSVNTAVHPYPGAHVKLATYAAGLMRKLIGGTKRRIQP